MFVHVWKSLSVKQAVMFVVLMEMSVETKGQCSRLNGTWEEDAALSSIQSRAHQWA